MLRKIKRNILKNAIGNNKIRKTWRDLQIHKHGEQKWLNMYNKCVGKMSRDEMYL